MMRLLAYAPTGREFATSDALNDIGASAICPRKVNLIRLPKQRRPQIVEEPFLRGYMFCTMTAAQWHQAKRDNITFTTCREIGPGEWRNVQAFAARVEQDYQYRMAQIEAGNRLSEYNPGDALEILGGVMQGHMATFLRLHDGKVPMIEAQIADMELLGKPIRVTLDPINARRIALNA